MVFTKDENDISQYILQELYYIVSELIVEKRNGFHILAMRKKHLYITEYENSDYIIMRCSKELKPIFFEADNIDNWNGEVFPEELCFYRKKRNGFHILAMRKKHLYIMKQRGILTFLTKKALSSIEYKQINRLWNCS